MASPGFEVNSAIRTSNISSINSMLFELECFFPVIIIVINKQIDKLKKKTHTYIYIYMLASIAQAWILGWFCDGLPTVVALVTLGM